jgi:outer membrane protein insertion porin family
MRRRGTAVFTSLLLALVVAGGLVAAGTARAGEPDSEADKPSITISGNRHMGADMIRSFFHAGPDGRFTPAVVDAAVKDLYGTGLFSDVKISRAGERILVIVSENPTLGTVAFEGNRRLKDAELKKEIQSKPGGPLSRAQVQADVVRLGDVYRQHGYYNARIVPKTVAARPDDPAGRVSLVFEINEGDKVAVRQIVFAGNTAYSATRLSGVVRTGLTNVFSLLLDNDLYDPDAVDADRERLRRFYRDHGFADVRVGGSSRYDPARNGIVVTFKIDEGRAYRFGKIDIDSAVKSVNVAVLRPALLTEPGAVFDAETVDKSADALAIALARNGEPFAGVTPQIEQHAERGTIDVIYTISAGKRLYVERIEIHGNLKTRDEVIRREFDVAEGDPYNRALIDRAKRRLEALGYFKSVKIASQPGSSPDRVVLDVTVEEDKTGSFFVSAGYSPTDGVLGQLNIGDRNFLGTGDMLKASIVYGQYLRSFEVGLSDPWFFGPHVGAGVDLFGRQSLANSYQSFNTTMYGAKFVANTPVNDNIGVNWNYSIYNQGLTLGTALGTPSLPIQQAAQQGSYWVSSIGNSLTYSTLDDPKHPTSGILAQSNNDFAGFGGAAKFARSTEDVRLYRDLGGDVVGMVRGQAGYVTPWGGQQLPLLDGFFGGPQLIRGFAPNGFGPRDVTPGTTMDNLGGNVYWTTTAELQAPMPFVTPDAQLKVALFSDTGSLWANGASSVTGLAASSPSQQIANSNAIRAAVGASLIWDSMFGPVRVDYAFPIAKQGYDVVQPLQFHAGGF